MWAIRTMLKYLQNIQLSIIMQQWTNHCHCLCFNDRTHSLHYVKLTDMLRRDRKVFDFRCEF